MRVLVTGGAGYIGSHTCVELLQAGHEVVVFDNLSNSKRESLRRVARIVGRGVTFVQGDVRDAEALDQLFLDNAVDAVIHFAGLKAVGESVAQPCLYYDNNVTGSLRLIEAMQRANVRTVVFSSTATVYGEPEEIPVNERARLSPESPYARSKLMGEDMFRDVSRADASWRIGLLRYFNPVGAHQSGLIGEDPNGIPNNLMPFLSQVAIGRRSELAVFGNDYPTADGTGVRDYIHVVDLAEGHVRALDVLKADSPRVLTLNLGTGIGLSVLQMVAAFGQAVGRPLPYRIAPRRAGDVAEYYADPAQAEAVLGWRATRGVAAMCADTWRWQSQNPDGYGAED